MSLPGFGFQITFDCVHWDGMHSRRIMDFYMKRSSSTLLFDCSLRTSGLMPSGPGYFFAFEAMYYLDYIVSGEC